MPVKDFVSSHTVEELHEYLASWQLDPPESGFGVGVRPKANTPLQAKIALEAMALKNKVRNNG